jgi:hypothetical protein
MIAETLAGIALVKSAVEGIKGAINTAKDISEIASHVDNLLEGEQQLQKKRSKKSSGQSIGDQLGIKSVAQEVIDARLAQEQINEMRNMIDLRFGHGTWQSIVDLRAKRLQQAKELALEERKKKIKEHKEFVETMKGVGLAAVVVIFMLVALIGVFAIQ